MLAEGGEVNNSNWVMNSEKTRVYGSFNRFEATASHVCFADCLNFLDAILLTELIKSIVDLIKQLNQFSSTVILNDLVEFININEDYCGYALRIWKVDLAFWSALSDQTRNQEVDDSFELLELLYLPVVRDELDFAIDLVPIRVVDPLYKVDANADNLPCLVHHNSTQLTLNASQTDV